MSRFKYHYLRIVSLAALLVFSTVNADQYARFIHMGEAHVGRLVGDELLVIEGGLFPMGAETGLSIPVDDVEWLPPTQPQKVFAVGMNFSSHRASRASAAPPVFLKLPSSLIGHNKNIVFPVGADNVHFEGELVLVIGQRTSRVSEEDAMDYVFGASAGNDLTERTWQRKDLQWLRAKASDGFGPVGPVVATNIDYSNVVITTRLNDEIVQQENTKNMIHSPAKVVSYLSQYFTLEPGDLIFMGTPGKTRSLNNEDVISVSINGIGTVANTIAKDK